MRGTLPVSVVIPTVGRPARLHACLDSLSRCAPGATEVVVIDQSDDTISAGVVAAYAGIGARMVPRPGRRGSGAARNVGLEHARNDIVAMTDDDCTVHTSWIERAWWHMRDAPDAIVTGRVLAAGDPRAVPSTIFDTTAREYTGELHCGKLYTGNMACRRASLLAFGAFDARIVPTAEDNDLCYRWLRAGRALRFEPDLVVWHHDWRTPPELERLFEDYARGQGVFYAKHLLRGDATMLRFLAHDVSDAFRAAVVGLLRGRPRWSDSRRGLLRGMPAGLVDGFRLFAREAGSGRPIRRRASPPGRRSGPRSRGREG